MIVCPRWRFVYIGPPKTATTTLHRWLSGPLFAGQRWGPVLGYPQHDTNPPARARAYFCFASIRDPVARALSQWRHSQTAPSRDAGAPRMTLAQFLTWQENGAGWFYSATCAEFLAGVRLDAVVRVEHLAADLAALAPIATALGAGEDHGRPGIIEPLPHLNATAATAPPVEALDPSTRRAIEHRGRADLDMIARLAPGVTPPA